MDMSQYYGLFISEAREHVKKIAELAVILEADTEDRPTIDALFRSAHSLKGMAASMEFKRTAELAHKMEDLMDRVRHGMKIDAGLFDLLLAGADQLSTMIDCLEQGGREGEGEDALLAKISDYCSSMEGTPPTHSPKVAVPAEAGPSSPVIERRASVGNDAFEPSQTVRVKTGVLDCLVNSTGELITVKHRLALLAESIKDNHLSESIRDLGRHLRELHDQVMTVRLIPLAAISGRFPRMVRDLARKSGKEVSLAMTGMEIELDRSILDRLGDPLSHILRNCADHGIESATERAKAGKPAVGTISLSVLRNKDQVEIAIADDGKGMVPDKIARAAVGKQIITAERAHELTDQEKLMLICQPGFSTVEQVTEISGRGVGMDVVRSTLQALGGTLAISSQAGVGSTFVLKLPMTIAIINVLLVAAGNLTLAVPVTNLLHTLELRRDDLATIDNQEVFFLEDEPVPLLQLTRLLNINADTSDREVFPLFISEVKGKKVGIIVDHLLGQKEVFVRPLGRPLSALSGMSGATIMGDGEIVFILDILTIV